MIVDDFLADFKQEGEDPFVKTEETPSDSPTEKKEEGDKPETGDNTSEQVPFHKHPRWIEREKELNDLKAREEATAKEIAELRAMQSRPTGQDAIPQWFEKLYGANQEAWVAYRDREKVREEEIEQRVIERQKQTQQQQVAEQKKWEGWVDAEVARLQGEGKVFDRNKLLKVMVDYGPTTGDSFDFNKGYAIYEKLEAPDTEKSQARKQLADQTTTSTRGEKPKKDYMTTADLRHKSWGVIGS